MAQKLSRTANGERLILCEKPKARLVAFESQMMFAEFGAQIVRYSTAHKVIFEKHSFPTGKVLWYKVKP